MSSVMVLILSLVLTLARWTSMVLRLTWIWSATSFVLFPWAISRKTSNSRSVRCRIEGDHLRIALIWCAAANGNPSSSNCPALATTMTLPTKGQAWSNPGEFENISSTAHQRNGTAAYRPGFARWQPRLLCAFLSGLSPWLLFWPTSRWRRPQF